MLFMYWGWTWKSKIYCNYVMVYHLKLWFIFRCSIMNRDSFALKFWVQTNIYKLCKQTFLLYLHNSLLHHSYIQLYLLHHHKYYLRNPCTLDLVVLGLLFLVWLFQHMHQKKVLKKINM